MKRISFLIIMFSIFCLFAAPALSWDSHTRATGSSTIATTVAPTTTKSWLLHQVFLHLTGDGDSGSFTITMDANAGAAYDILLYSQDLSSLTSHEVRFDPPLKFATDDEVDFAWANPTGRTYGLDIIHTVQ